MKDGTPTAAEWSIIYTRVMAPLPDPDGTYYEGQFANGAISGKGELTFADGKVFW